VHSGVQLQQRIECRASFTVVTFFKLTDLIQLTDLTVIDLTDLPAG